MIVVIVMIVTVREVVGSECIIAGGNDGLSSTSDLHAPDRLRFSLDLFREVYARSSPESNVVISPESVWGGLLLAYLASSGRTQRQMEQVLGFHDKSSALGTWRLLQHMWGEDAGNSSLAVVNRVFVDPRLVLNQCVADRLTDELSTVDFLQYREAAAGINRMVSEWTQGRLGNLVQPDDLQNALMVLVSAAAFRGTWVERFPVPDTALARFFTHLHRFTHVPTMVLSTRLRYGESSVLGASLLELPYSGGSWSMFLLLPDLAPHLASPHLGQPHLASPHLGLDGLLSRLTPAALRSAVGDMSPRQVTVEVPRIKVDYALKDNLKRVLYDLGISELFSKSADLTALAPYGDLVVSQSLHQASLEVTEEGTQAAAATAFISLARSRPPPPISFHCNRPFVFLVYDNLSASIMFIGAYRRPQE
ncbi:leukocyte elastase inhibitor-like [Procambarus clarkii]|uniref:leukocyte elastase inhibitor-like n=1 Tax=Procambarus clarkii TaxID=6728 RepID=UPI00374410E1